MQWRTRTAFLGGRSFFGGGDDFFLPTIGDRRPLPLFPKEPSAGPASATQPTNPSTELNPATYRPEPAPESEPEREHEPGDSRALDEAKTSFLGVAVGYFLTMLTASSLLSKTN